MVEKLNMVDRLNGTQEKFLELDSSVQQVLRRTRNL